MAGSEDRFRGLLRDRRIVPLLITQFLGAFNDNLFKNAALLLILFHIAETESLDGKIIVTVAAGLFVLPYIVFSSLAGHLADRFDKALVMRAVKTAEVPIMGLAAYGFATAQAPVLLLALFLMGTQSAFFSPSKYGYIPDAVPAAQLIGANALIETSTFLAILTGSIAGGLLVMEASSPWFAAAAVLLLAAAGLMASFFIPKVGAQAPDTRIGANILGETIAVLRHARSRRDIWLTILGISWFWFFGATLLTQVPAFTKEVIVASEAVVVLQLTVVSIAIGAGSLLCQWLLRDEVSVKFVPIAALAMAGFAWVFVALGATYVPGPERVTLGHFLSDGRNLLFLASLAGLGLSSGLYIVPLNAFLQHRAEARHRSRTMAANNIVNALAMVLSSGLVALLFLLDLAVIDVFVGLAMTSVVAALVICRLLPQQLVKGLLAGLLRVAFRTDVKGLANAEAAGAKAIYIANHASFIDGLFLAAFLPGKPVFAVATNQAAKWWVKPFLALVPHFPIDTTSPFATKALIRKVEDGHPLVIFPEGRLTRTGALMKIYEGPGMVAARTGAKLVPLRLEGIEYSYFSRLAQKLPRRLLPKVTLTILPPQSCRAPAGLVGRARRKAIAQQVYDLMSDMMFETGRRQETLFEALLAAKATFGGKLAIVEDPERRPLSYKRLISSAALLGRRLERAIPGEATIGLMLPNSAGAAVAFFALQAGGRVPALINYTMGPAGILASCRAARVATIVTSHRFVKLAKLEETLAALERSLRILYLEDLRRQIGWRDTLSAVLERPFLGARYRRRGQGPGDTAVVLFTSGSEGTPKGVALSHANILANCGQIAARIDFTSADRVFNTLPLFHAFGLTGGFLLPLLAGVKTFLYPSPLHYRIVPELVYDTDATILFGTDTFLAGYGKKANPYDFYSLRYVFAGAERLQAETRRLWSEKFGLRILEGYGATECAPVIALNTPMHFKAGSVGRPLPGIETRIEAVPGIARGGRLSVRGPNVMRGYYRSDNPGRLEPPPAGWYDTGDIVEVDDEGFLTIAGRAKRFAKIAGEMISLAAVEALARSLWPDDGHAAIALPDERKGEKLLLLSDRPRLSRQELLDQARRQGLSELTVPRLLFSVDRIPLLGSGKTDYPAATALAETALAGAVAR